LREGVAAGGLGVVATATAGHEQRRHDGEEGSAGQEAPAIGAGGSGRDRELCVGHGGFHRREATNLDTSHDGPMKRCDQGQAQCSSLKISGCDVHVTARRGPLARLRLAPLPGAVPGRDEHSAGRHGLNTVYALCRKNFRIGFGAFGRVGR